MINIIGINGYIESGKDTVGGIIQDLTMPAAITVSVFEKERILKHFDDVLKNNWQIKKYAAKLKQVASLILGIPVEKFEDQEFKKTLLPKEWNVPVPGMKGFTAAMTVREFLQKLGTEAIRDGIHTNAWVNALYADYKEGDKWLITDCRFPNEAQGIKNRGGIVIRVNRGEQKDTSNLHPSETSLDNWTFDYVVDNDSTLDELKVKLSYMLDHFDIEMTKTPTI